MRIAVNLRHFIPGQIGGMEKYVRNILPGILELDTKREIEFLLLTNKQNHDTLDFEDERVRKIQIGHDDVDNTISKILDIFKAEILFCPLLVLEPLGANIPGVVKIPDLQHLFFPDFFSEEVMQFREENYRPSAEKADIVFTLSEFSKQTIVEKFEINPGKILVVYLDADEVFSQPVSSRSLQDIKAKYKLPDRYLLYPANTWPHKNHANLLKAMKIYNDKHPEKLHLVLTGAAANYHDQIVALVEELGLSETVHMLGFLETEDMPGLYHLAQALIYPTLFEGFGLPLLEAFHCGCPAISSRRGSCPELGGDAVLYIENPEDPDEIVGAIETLENDSSLQEDLIAKGKIQIQKFSWDRGSKIVCETFHRVYRRHYVTVLDDCEPKVSIITPSYNQGKFIEQTIQSVLTQDYPNIEYVIVDGGSTDNTIEILEKYSSQIKWISEPDNGQTDAINKGLRMVSGEIVAYLNSDDYYLPGAVGKAVDYFRKNWDCAFIYGEGIVVDEEGNFIDRYLTLPFDYELLANDCYICQPAVFIRQDVLEELGHFDGDNDLCMDYDLWIRMGKDNKVGYMNEYLAASRSHPQTKSLSRREQIYESVLRTVKKHYGYVPRSWTNGYSHFLAYGTDPKPAPTIALKIKRRLKYHFLKLYLPLKWAR